MKLSTRPEGKIAPGKRLGASHILLGSLAALVLAGCSVREAPVITAKAGAVPARNTVVLMKPEASQTSLLALRNALSSELADSGYAISEDGRVIMDLALSTSKAQDAFYASEAGADAPDPTPIVVVREQRFLDACTAMRTRTKLVAYSRATGELIASREAEAIGCEGDAVPYTELARLLVSQLSD